MTKQEFIQEAALRIVERNSDAPVSFITNLARELADEIYPQEEQPQEETQQHDDTHDDPIGILIAEVERIEKEEVAELNKKNEEKWGTKIYNAQKGGSAARINSMCRVYDITKVMQLFIMGRREFLRTRYIGPKTAELVDKALLNLYGITRW